MNVWRPCIWGVFSKTNRLFGRLLPLSAEWANLVRSLKPLWKYYNSLNMAKFSFHFHFHLCNFPKWYTCTVIHLQIYFSLDVIFTKIPWYGHWPDFCFHNCTFYWNPYLRNYLWRLNLNIPDLVTWWIGLCENKVLAISKYFTVLLSIQNIMIVRRNMYLLKLSMDMHDNEINGHSVLSTCNSSTIQ